ncbi:MULTISPECIES: sulfite exporter TauE/SafE family protein [Pseudovibrio]|uniref:sulfite exporter TauE/SafE family protein n=1 Tax=Stappiaceae TaxID=2821832 RepID=UPI0023665A17|nr:MULTISPECIES: sulfite exporter TauE/SafE family protein [Pseudovibrio]MDD7911685.1 sulfite exporter TauE/SafE family protein [Pseudovibrio exalbescens]MDX5594418.1 sulfite exporter TauE/SafE family protein [Pseudovibrio sp. SPO723]
MYIEILIVSAIIALGSFTQGLTGFGLALVSVPLLSMAIDVKAAVPIAGIFGWLVTFPLVWKMREHVQWKTGLILFVGSLPGSFLGADLLKRMPAEAILITMGVVLIASSLYSLFSKAPLFKKTSPPITLGTGFFSGALGASVGEPGPPVIAYTSMQPWTADQTKSTLVFFFMLQMVGAIAGFWSKGLIDAYVMERVAYAMPAFIVGMTVGMFAYHLLHKYKINYHGIIHSLLLVVGAMLIIKNLHLW